MPISAPTGCAPLSDEAIRRLARCRNNADFVSEYFKALRPKPCPVLRLPTEVQRQILFLLPTDALFACIRASAIFWRAYQANERALLWNILTRELGGVIVESCTLQRLIAVFALENPSDEAREEAVERYEPAHNAMSQCYMPPWLGETLTDGEVRLMAKEYLTLIRPATKLYTNWALENLAGDTLTSRMERPSLSLSERRRVARGLYRFEMYCQLYGEHENRDAKDSDWVLFFPDHFSFMELWEPWQIEQFRTVYLFEVDVYARVLASTLEDTTFKGPLEVYLARRGSHLPYNGLWQDAKTDQYHFENMQIGTAIRGLAPLLHIKLDFNDDDKAAFTKAVKSIAVYPDRGNPDHTVLSPETQERECDVRTARVQKASRRDPMPFRGDGEPDAEGDRPPYAWTVMWRNRYCKLYGWFIPVYIGNGGYVMWDAERIKTTGADRQLRGDFANAGYDMYGYVECWGW
ncbi:hypothetical protein B0J18DRAFT_439891 [Chaetomium sp. MPI-SDFR-AT-0129]|nr:hypothetical protein B0J18DRAFT_439891 [Chaetomium sp. MPI-SDFR-AT-0129]